jgi:hypothetical protein
MQALVVLKLEMAPQAVDGFLHIAIIFHIHLLVLDTPP